MNKTTFGYELRAVGFNSDAAKYAGINVNRNAILAMTLSGTFAGLAGCLITCGTFNYARVIPAFENYGFNGIVAALIGGNTAIGSVFGGLLFGALQAIQPIMQANGIPRDIAIIITSSIIIFVAMKNGIRSVLNKIGKKEA
jgi:simple sugar transport system permease protein